MRMHAQMNRNNRIAQAAPVLQTSSDWTWRIGEGRVTTEEFESWQLGPDLSATHVEELRRRAS